MKSPLLLVASIAVVLIGAVIGCQESRNGCDGDSCTIQSAMVVVDHRGNPFCFVAEQNGSLCLIGMAQRTSHPSRRTIQVPIGEPVNVPFPIGEKPVGPTVQVPIGENALGQMPPNET